MNQESTTWFNSAYSFVRGKFPFGILTGIVSVNDMRHVGYSKWPRKKIKRVLRTVRGFYDRMPSEEDFQEEKDRVLEKLVPKLRERFSFAETGISFGRMRGDLDIGLISLNEIGDEQFKQLVYREAAIFMRYPIADLEALFYFRCKSGHELAEKIAKSRIQSSGRENMDIYEVCYIMETIHSARLLWGDAQEIEGMRNCFSKRYQEYLAIRNKTPS